MTRPARQNEALADAAVKLGRHVIEFPALSIGAPADASGLDRALAKLEHYALVIFVSPNAIDLALDRLDRRWPESVPIAVMGPGSRARLAARGIAAPPYRITTPLDGPERRLDSEALYKALDLESLAGRPVLIVRGNGGRDWLLEALKARDIEVAAVAAYQRSIGVPMPDALKEVRALIDTDAKASVMITSSEAISTLLELFLKHFGQPGVSWFKRQQIVVSHRRIAENATAAGFASVHQADAGDEALVRALEYLP